jgi:malonyl-CoA/methylmalonyl-CoA synthetase
LKGSNINRQSHITDYLELHARTIGDQPAIFFEEQQISWSELWENVQRLSYFFAEELGNHEQRVVGMLMTNSIDFVVIYLAILHAGHIAAPIDPVYKKLEIDAIVKQLNPAMIVVQRRYTDQISKHDQRLLDAANVIEKSDSSSGRLLRLAAKDQVASLTFTSGTSGQAKIVPNTHANHIWNIKTCSKVWDWMQKDSLLITLPLSHMHGLVMGLSGVIYHGNTMYLRQQSFNAEETLEELASGKISFFTHAPLAYMKMLQAVGDYDLTKLRLCISGSAPLPPSVWQAFKNRFGAEILETYGSTETGRIAANELEHRQLGSPGKILPGVDVKFSKDGEVLIKSGGVFPGYWKNNRATRAATTTDGYWRTGDIGELKNGYLFLKGKVQERIRRFGYTISPRDVEWALLENHNIKEALVVGQQQPTQPNDQLTYFIVGSISPAEVADYSKANLPFSWRPDKVFILKSLPRNRSGKPKLAELKQMAKEMTSA